MHISKIYKFLQINEHTSELDVRKQYKRLCQMWHPDKNPHNVGNATAMFINVKEAYTAWIKLSKPQIVNTYQTQPQKPSKNNNSEDIVRNNKKMPPHVPTVHTIVLSLVECFEQKQLYIPCETWTTCKHCQKIGCAKCQYKGHVLETIEQSIVLDPWSMHQKPYRIQGHGFTLLLRTTISNHKYYRVNATALEAVVEIDKVPHEKITAYLEHIDGTKISFCIDQYARHMDRIELPNKGLYHLKNERGPLVLQLHVKGKTR